MLRHRILPLALILPLLAGCATSADPTVSIPPVPADVQACAISPVAVPDRTLSAGEVERLWKTDRAALAKVNACFHRLLCQYGEVRRGIAKANDPLCRGA